MAYDKQTPTLRLLTASGEHRIGWGRVVGYALLVAALIAMLVPGFARAQPPERRWAEARILVQPKAGLPEEHFGVGRLGGDCDRGDRGRTNAGVGRPGWGDQGRTNAIL